MSEKPMTAECAVSYARMWEHVAAMRLTYAINGWGIRDIAMADTYEAMHLAAQCWVAAAIALVGEEPS